LANISIIIVNEERKMVKMQTL